MARSPRSTTEWVATSLREAEDVSEVEVLSDRVIRVTRSTFEPFIAGIVSAPRVERETLQPVVSPNLGVEIVANIPKEAFWTGGALKLAAEHNMATGSFGDLYRAIREEDVRAFQPSETAFVERGLRQHSRVTTFDRLHDRLYSISRKGLPDLIAVMLNEYELTADHLRAARDRYGPFSVAVITNPNGQSTTAADEAAVNMDVEVLKWAPFFGRLNKA
ncbi:hypothetical protein [Bradyrhizobium sp. G127]|uniref:hypothetical protein n=1 Tax=Bradyrhizobium sp. G127 TaxID=2904800 RepID=UPI001F2E00A5|nr:hypothetical protein [Bradyrhizobium sp. G127]MCF2523623.1 hypothetical protein [Bradyrhizobium sp. G127]